MRRIKSVLLVLSLGVSITNIGNFTSHGIKMTTIKDIKGLLK